MYEFINILSRQTDYQEIVRLIANKSSQLFSADTALILMLNPDTRETIKTIIKDGKNIGKDNYRNINIHVGSWIVTNSKPFYTKNIKKDNRFLKGLFKNLNVRSVLGVPLVMEGIVFGSLILIYKDSNNSYDNKLVEHLNFFSYIMAPFLRNAQKLRPFFESTIPESSLIFKYKNVGLIGKSTQFIELLKAIESATKCDAKVLLIGNTGTGKELIAKAIHKFSDRAKYPFVAIDCGAIPSTLIESELFGHKEGAFTGAKKERQGLFLEANGGTLFMDEINNLPMNIQAKLLRVLQEGEIRPVGSDKTLNINVRILAAASSPLKKLVDKKKFREDLFFRLNVYPIYIPDLDERKEDIPYLANYFLDKFSSEQNKNLTRFHEEMLDFIKQFKWKGNIRELENFVQRLVTLSTKKVTVISSELLPPDMTEKFNQHKNRKVIKKPTFSIKEKVKNYEAGILRQTLIDCNWNNSEAARRLETTEKTIRYKIESLNIKRTTQNK